MIHTFELRYDTTPDILTRIMHDCRFSQDKVARMNNFIDSTDETLTYYYGNEAYVPGINNVTIKAFKEKIDGVLTGSYSAYVKLQIEPQALLEGHSTLNLFRCTPENVAALRQRLITYLQFQMQTDIICIKRLQDWKCYRVDYTRDVYCENVPLLLALLKRADHRGTGKYDNNGKHSSLEKAYNAYKFIVYDKHASFQKDRDELEAQEETVNKATQISELDELIEASPNILRIECQCKSGKLRDLKKKYGVDMNDKSVFSLLSEEIAEALLCKQYMNTIGSGNFYKYYSVCKYINEQVSLTSGKKKSLINTLRLIAQARGALNARQQFIDGVTIKNTDIYLHGSRVTFNSYIKQLESLGIAPILIPKDWYTQKPYGELPNIFQNPIPDEWRTRHL